uniref:Uncharacterized protein n=1 Tax=Panagrellus redivivus TaxID=6233 RepID=A0A7E4VI01_PANRE
MDALETNANPHRMSRIPLGNRLQTGLGTVVHKLDSIRRHLRGCVDGADVGLDEAMQPDRPSAPFTTTPDFITKLPTQPESTCLNLLGLPLKRIFDLALSTCKPEISFIDGNKAVFYPPKT